MVSRNTKPSRRKLIPKMTREKFHLVKRRSTLFSLCALLLIATCLANAQNENVLHSFSGTPD